jgi:hypothetical protein
VVVDWSGLGDALECVVSAIEWLGDRAARRRHDRSARRRKVERATDTGARNGMGCSAAPEVDRNTMTESTYRIHGATGEWEVVIGLEVHAQVTSNAKLFSGSATAFGAEPNSQVSLVDAAMPGMLPVPNMECIRQAVRTGMAIEAQINKYSRFDRKNYFYADLPQGYQISQLYHPIVGEGEIEITLDEKNRDLEKGHRRRAHPCRAGCGQADA